MRRASTPVLALVAAFACARPSADALRSVDFTPLPSTEWTVSTPDAEGLPRDAVARLYWEAARLEHVYGVLLFRHGRLVAEDYFGPGAVDQRLNVHSVTKSITATLVGIALDRGCIRDLDQPMMSFFPELDDRLTDPRKRDITLREMLEMRAGYPWEESTPELLDRLFTGFHASTLVDVPLVRDPGSGFEYSNLTSHLLGIVVARACGTDLRTFAREALFDPLGIEPGFWQQDWDGNYLGFSDIELTARDLARIGLLYRDGGLHRGERVVSQAWTREVRVPRSRDAWPFRVGSNWGEPAYGYQWWSVRAGDRRYDLAWGHGGQQIVLLDDLDLVMVVTVDPLHLQHGGGPWRIEKANLNLVADFIASLPPSLPPAP